MENLNEFVVVLYFVVLIDPGRFRRPPVFYGLSCIIKIKKPRPSPKRKFDKLPRVTIQLPMYNEMYVAERLIDAVVKMDYPRELLEIQVLDDSTDETVAIASRRVEHYKEQGLDISYLHRQNRKGYKAGALEEGMKVAKGEFIAVFDADFIPHKHFLTNTIHFFTAPNIGMVQMRWSHLNRNFSLITNLQSIFLDGHFVIEHTARNRSGRFFNFNGTAGIWRKAAIIDGGGWQHDTLTEDLDLSYRTQMKGWQFIYLPDFSVPAELPVDIVAFKAQQHRWAKGSIQTAKKLLPKIFRAKLPLAREGRGLFPPGGQLCLPADGAAVGLHPAGGPDAPRHELGPDVHLRRAPLSHGHGFGLGVLYRFAEGALFQLDHHLQVPAPADGPGHRIVGQQFVRRRGSPAEQGIGIRAHSQVRHRKEERQLGRPRNTRATRTS